MAAKILDQLIRHSPAKNTAAMQAILTEFSFYIRVKGDYLSQNSRYQKSTV